MASTKDLLEAHGYARRRLVAAFLSGSPVLDDGVGPVRGLVAGLIVAGLLVAAAAAYVRFS